MNNLFKYTINVRRLFVFFCSFFIFFIILFSHKFCNLKEHHALTICTFADLIKPEMIDKFKEKTGMNVIVKYCELDAEFWTQLSTNNGEGFDLITPVDGIVARLKNANLLKKIDKSKIENISGIDDKFLSKEFDKNLDYCLPFAWTYYAIGYKKKFFENANKLPNSLQAIFEPNKFFVNYLDLLTNYKIAFFEDNPLEMLFLAGQYLLGDEIETLNQTAMQDLVKATFIQMKNNWLYAFVAANMQYYLSAVVPVVISYASMLKDLVEESPEEFGILFPKEGSVLVQQNFCIPKGAIHENEAHEFINFFLSEEMLKDVFDSSGYLPVKTEALIDIKNENPGFGDLIPNQEQFDKLIFVKQLFSAEKTEEIWLSIKS